MKQPTHKDQAQDDWRTDKRWQSQRISSGANKNHWLGFGLGLFVLLIALPGTLAIPEELAKDNWPILAVLLFDLIAAGFFAHALREWLAWRRYGEIHAHLSPWPGSLGGAVAGHFELTQALPADHRLSVSLQCTRMLKRSKNNSSKVLWMQQEQLQAASPVERQIWFYFQPPADMPQSGQDGNRRITWQLRLEVRQPGPDLVRQYNIPVMPGLRDNDAAQRKTRVLTQKREQDVAEELNLYQRPDGVSMVFGPWRHWKGALAFGVFGGFCLGGSWMVSQEGSLITGFMASVFGLLGIAMVIGAIWALGQKRAVLLASDLAATRLFWFALPVRRRQVERKKILHFDWERTGSMQSGNKTVLYYQLMLNIQGEKPLVLCQGLEGEAKARTAAEQLARHTGIALPD